jgi:hypothetical protein
VLEARLSQFPEGTIFDQDRGLNDFL